MFPFWHDVVAPILEAAGAKRIVEIGALRGDQTELMLGRLGQDVELHVVDPVPYFDPTEHERRFAGRYVFHRDLSVNVLGQLPPMDAALIDGDHNWYTVFTELTLLADVARRAAAPMPVMVLHDVCWPYGRRDLYYDPSNIPEQHRQPWRRAGLRRGERGLLPGGGMNSNLAHAEVEGGPRNGVMTAIEDFVAAHDRPLRLVVLPILFGLAILVDEERLAAQPRLAAALAWLEGPEGKDMLLRLGENFRVDSLLLDHAFLEQTGKRAAGVARRYLETVKRSLVGDPGTDALTGGEATRQQRGPTPDRTALDHLHGCLDTVWGTLVAGDLAVTSVGAGESPAFAAAYLEAHDHQTRPDLRRGLWIVGPFRMGTGSDSEEGIEQVLQRFDLLSDRIRFLPGGVDAAPPDARPNQLALIHIGRGARADAGVALEALYPLLTARGIVAIDDMDDPVTSGAVEGYRSTHGIAAPLERSGAPHARWHK